MSRFLGERVQKFFPLQLSSWISGGGNNADRSTAALYLLSDFQGPYAHG